MQKIMFRIDKFTQEEKLVIDYFDQLKVTKKIGRKWLISLPILEHVLNRTNQNLSINKNVDGELMLGSYPLDSALTQNEYKTLVLLYNNKNPWLIVTRWQKPFGEAYILTNTPIGQ